MEKENVTGAERNLGKAPLILVSQTEQTITTVVQKMLVGELTWGGFKMPIPRTIKEMHDHCMKSNQRVIINSGKVQGYLHEEWDGQNLYKTCKKSIKKMR